MLPLFFLKKNKKGDTRLYARVLVNKTLGWDNIIQKASHKYIKRIATGNPKRPWDYIYKESEEAHTNSSNTIQGNAKNKSGSSNGGDGGSGTGGGDGGEPPKDDTKAKLRLELKKELSKYKDKDIVNKKTGNIARIANAGISKISSDKAIAKSIANGFTLDEHFEIARQLVSLFKDSVLISKKDDERSNSGDVEIERYLSQKVTLQSGKKAQALITVKYTKSINGRRIYSMEAIDIMNIKNVPHQVGARVDRTLSNNNASINTSTIPPSTKKSTHKGEKGIKKSLFFIYRGRLYARVAGGITNRGKKGYV